MTPLAVFRRLIGLPSTTSTILTQISDKPLVRLETVPKAAYLRLGPELDFYDAFFSHPEVEYCRDWDGLEKTADRVARQSGLSAMDALHVAAASLLGADELITTERPPKPIYRNRLVEVVYLYADL